MKKQITSCLDVMANCVASMLYGGTVFALGFSGLNSLLSYLSRYEPNLVVNIIPIILVLSLIGIGTLLLAGLCSPENMFNSGFFKDDKKA